jgi:uncharacterized protein (UPF0548 family)
MTDLRIVSHPDFRDRLARLRTTELNFRPRQDGPFTRQQGWRLDHYRRRLPSEPPGPPVPGGSWELAKRLSETYEFADPTLVRAFYDPREPLIGRTMLLEVHFWGLRIYAGVRVGGASDGIREHDGRRARVAVWNYQTLEDHFESGQIDYEVWKWLDSGEVEFRVDAFSRPAPIDQPIVRMGFRLFGRRTQIKFARHAGLRMAKLTEAALSGDPRAEPAPLVAADLAVRPQPDKQTLLERSVRRVRGRKPPRE